MKTSFGKGSHHIREKEIKERKDEFYNKAWLEYNSFVTQSNMDARFEAGDQSVFDEHYANIPNPSRKKYVFNKLRPIVNMISGNQRQERKAITIEPVENADQETADQYSKVMSHIVRRDGMMETFSQSHQDSLIGGFNLLHVWNDYTLDPLSGNLRLDSYNPNSFLIDPFFKRLDLTDCNNIWKRTYLSPQQIKLLWPDNNTSIEELRKKGYTDSKFITMPESLSANKSDLMAYDEFYYLDSREKVFLTDLNTNEVLDYDGSDFSEEELEAFLKLYPFVERTKRRVPTVRLAIFVNDSLIYDGVNLLGIDEYPFIPMLSYFRPSLSSMSLRMQGVIRGLRDPQFLYNRRKIIEDNMISSRITTGYIYKEGAVLDEDDLFRVGEGSSIGLKETAEMTDIQPITPPQIPPSWFQLSESYGKELLSISGVNEELLGSASDDKAAILARARQGAALVTLKPIMDNLDKAHTLLGRILLKSTQVNYFPAKIKRIIEEEPTPQFYNKAFGIYDAVVTAGFDTTTQKLQGFANLVELKELGVAIPYTSLINAAHIQNKGDLLEAIDQQNKFQEQQMMKQDHIQQELVKAQTEKAKADVESELSLAKERDSRVFSNIGLMEERQLEAEKDKSQAVLNLVKTIQEMEGIDLDQLAKLVQISKLVEQEAGLDETKALGGAIVGGATKDVPEVPDRTGR